MKRCNISFRSIGVLVVGSSFIRPASRIRGGWLNKLFCILSVVMAMSASSFAGTVNLFGKVMDTATGVALDSVIVKLNRTTSACTSAANGVFLLTGEVVNIRSGIVPGTGSFIRCAGANVHFTVRQQARVSIEAFNTLGKLLAKPFDKVVAPGEYLVPAGIGFATQIIYVRVTCGSDVRVFRMLGAMSRGTSQIQYDGRDAKQAPHFKGATAATADTLVFMRNSYAVKKVAISSLTSTDSVTVALWPGNATDSLGGRIYDKFWVAKSGYSQTDTALINRINKYADFFRCEQCHGYDLLGRAGTYANRAPTTKRPNVANINLLDSAKSASLAKLFEKIKFGADSTMRRPAAADVSTYDPATNATEGDKMPNYAAILPDKQIWNLLKFLKSGYTDPTLLFDCSISGAYPNAVVACSNIGKNGNTVLGDTIFTKNCKSCHGVNGKQIIMVEGIAYAAGSHVRAKPAEDIHRIKYHLYGNLPNYSLQQMKDLLKTLADTAKYPNSTKDDSSCYKSNGVNGGRMFDKFWVADTTVGQAYTALFNQFADFFRCEQCHGYDLQGRAGGYANRAPAANRPNVADVNLFATASTGINSDIFRLIKTGADSTKRRAGTANLSSYDPATNSTIGDQMPNYSAIFTDQKIWDMVKFFKYEILDVKQVYDCAVAGTYPAATIAFSNLGKNGSADTGNIYYTANCASCHGADGKLMLVDSTFSVGSHVRAKPDVDVHKIKFGVVGKAMKNRSITIAQMKNLYKALADTTKFPNP
jgi:mono/diheme cytochrome c family protein